VFCENFRSANFLRRIEKNSHFCADFCRSAQKQGAFCAPFCVIPVLRSANSTLSLSCTYAMTLSLRLATSFCVVCLHTILVLRNIQEIPCVYAFS
jgi:hypothetical protein